MIDTRRFLAAALLMATAFGVVVRADPDAGPPAPQELRSELRSIERQTIDAQASGGKGPAEPDALLERYDETALLRQWRRALPELRADLDEDLKSGDTFGLYMAQMKTSAVLQWAALHGNPTVLRGLAALYLRAFPYALERDRMESYYVHREGSRGKPKRTSPVEQPGGTRAWLPRGDDGELGPESVLQSSQFLYGVARLARALAEADIEVPAFDDEGWGLVTEHLARWIVSGEGQAGSFQRTGWGCGWGDFDHVEHVENLAARRYGTEALPGVRGEPVGYCNLATDTDMFVIAIAGEVLLANRRDPERFPLSSPQRDLLTHHVESGLELFESRMSRTSVKLPDGSETEGLVFDRGLSDSYPDEAYAGDEDPSYPGWTDEGEDSAREPRPGKGLGWDLSHARRFLLLSDTTAALDASGIVASPVGEGDLHALAVQTVLGTWNGDVAEPLFSNYVDGSNGWYRVNYEDRPGYGFAPWGFSGRVVGMGYGYWGCTDARIGKVILERAVADEANPIPSLSRNWFRAQWIASVLMSDCDRPR